MSEWGKYRRFIWIRAVSELKADVRTSHLGLAWWVLDPLIYMGVFYLVFAVGLRQGGEGFVPFLLVGLVAWRWFDFSVKKSASSLIDCRGLLSQIYLPKIVVPIVALVANSIRFLIIFSVLLVILLWMGSIQREGLVWLPLLLLSQLAFIVGLSFFLASTVPFVPDIRRLIDYGLSLLFFMSGIFYKIDQANSLMYSLFMCNPMAYFIESHRRAVLYGDSPDLVYLALHVSLAVILFFVGQYFLRRYDKLYPLVIQ